LGVVWRRISARARTSLGLSPATRTRDAPAFRIASACSTVASMSWVRVAHMLWMATGWPAPRLTVPILTERVVLFSHRPPTLTLPTLGRGTLIRGVLRPFIAIDRSRGVPGHQERGLSPAPRGPGCRGAWATRKWPWKE